jgi:hypothetical protein
VKSRIKVALVGCTSGAGSSGPGPLLITVIDELIEDDPHAQTAIDRTQASPHRPIALSAREGAELRPPVGRRYLAIT